jgi:hypothetical protein
MLRREFVCSLPLIGQLFQPKKKNLPPVWSVMAVVLAEKVYNKYRLCCIPHGSFGVCCDGETKLTTIKWTAKIHCTNGWVISESIELPQNCIDEKDHYRLVTTSLNFLSHMLQG